MNDAVHMRRALELAAARVGLTGSNPSVGCVIAKGEDIVAHAATDIGGRPHAEEQAVALAGAQAQGATAYVTVEPCALRSTGALSCADLLIRAGVTRVVVAARDPHPLASGAGLDRLRRAGIDVEVGLMEAEARAQNAAFFAQWDKPQS